MWIKRFGEGREKGFSLYLIWTSRMELFGRFRGGALKNNKLREVRTESWERNDDSERF